MRNLLCHVVGAAALVLMCSPAATLKAQNLYVANADTGIIGEYGLDGSTINASVISSDYAYAVSGMAFSGNDLFVASWDTDTIAEYTAFGGAVNVPLVDFGPDEPWGIAISGNDLFAVNQYYGTIGEYTTSGATINASLISGLDQPIAIAISGTNLFVLCPYSASVGEPPNITYIGTIGEYTTSGATVNASLITGLTNAGVNDVAISGTNLFVVSADGYVGKYTTSGGTVNAQLITGLDSPEGIAILGTNLFVGNSGGSTVGEYSTSGAKINSSLISGLNGVGSIAIGPVLVVVGQPQNQTAPLSSNVSFTVSANGVPPLSYQWFFINTNLQTAAGGYAQMFDGFVFGAVVTNGGSGYTTVPNVQFIGGGGSGAGGTAAISDGMVTAINVTNAGSAYALVPTVQIDPPNGLLVGQTNSTFTINYCTTNNAGNYFVVVSNAYGSMQSSIASLTIAYPPSICEQPQSIDAPEGQKVDFNVSASDFPPFGYQWWMVSPVLSNAIAVPVTINGFVLAATMTSEGDGYLSVPQVQIVGGSGSGAGGYAVVSNRMVLAITITNAGSGYTTPPTIEIAAPSAISLIGQSNSNLVLPGVTGGNDGNYFVIVTNFYGSVTSAVATLTVFLPPKSLTVSGYSGSRLCMQLTGTPSYPYVLQSTTNLTAPINWQSIFTNSADSNGNWSLTVTNVASPEMFYRAYGQ